MKEGWEIKKLGECFKLKSGDGLTRKKMNQKGDIPVFGGNGIAGSHDKYNISGNNIIVGRVGALCGNVRNTNENIWLTDNAFKVVDYKYDFDNVFLTYLLNFKNLRNYARQAAQPVISNSSLKNVYLEFPKSLKEQQQIVAILDKAFTAIDKAKANAQQNLLNAKQLFESYLQNVFVNGKLKVENGEWEEKRLDEITEVKDGTHDSPKYISDGIPFVTQKNIKNDGFNISNTKFITETDHNKFYKRSNVTFGDILISMIGANRGMSAIVDIKTVFSIKNVGLIKESENINQYFLLYYLQSTLALKYVKLMSNGGAQEFIGLRALRAFPIPFPKSIQEQQKIVKKLNALQTQTKKLETIYKQKTADLEELKKSVLQKAFNGELTQKELV